MIAKTAIVELLGRTPLFGTLDEAERRAVADEMREVNFDASQVIFARGDAGREIYLVVSGRVRISVLTAEGRELSFAHAEPGAIFGEIAMLDGGVRSADATAVNKVSALSLSKPAFKRLMETHPHVADAAVRFLCSRIREADQQLEAIALYPDRGPTGPLLPRRRARQGARQRGRSRHHRSADVAERTRAAHRRQPAEGKHGAVAAGGQAALSSATARASSATSRSCKPSPAPSEDAGARRPPSVWKNLRRACACRSTCVSSPRAQPLHCQSLKARLAVPLRPLLDSAIHQPHAPARDAASLRRERRPIRPTCAGG